MRQIPKPSLEDVFAAFQSDVFAKFNCHRIGVIEGFDTNNQSAKIRLIDKTVKETYNGNIEFNSILLVDCPVYINSDGAKGFERPIAVGEECLVLFNDRDIDNWFKAGAVNQRPNSARMHSLSDGLAIVGFHSNLKKITDFSQDLTRMRFDDTVIELDDKVKIENAAQNLKTLVDSLIDIIKALQVVDPVSGNLPITAATSTALDDIKIEFAALLK